MIYVRSEHYVDKMAKIDSARTADRSLLLFGRQEGRIAWANRKKDPLLLFAALHRQLGYPASPADEKGGFRGATVANTCTPRRAA